MLRFIAAHAAITYPIITACLLAGIWQLAVAQAETILIPTFTEVAGATLGLITDPELWSALWISNQAFLIGFGLAVAVGIPLGIASGRSPLVQQYLNPYLDILLVTPMAVIIPLLIMATGLGLVSRVILVFASSVVGVLVNAQVGVRQADPALLEMARSYGASELQLWRRIILPGSMPAIMAGVRLGLSQAIQAMVLIELLMVAVGVGRLMVEFRGRFQSGELWAVVVIVVLECLILVAIARWLERRVAPWAR